LVKNYEYEKGLYEYTDDEGYKRIGHWQQRYKVIHGYYGSGIVSRKKVGMVDFDQDEDDDYVDGVPDRRRNCPHCAQFELTMKLGVRRIAKDQPIPSDIDKWLECYHCGNIFPKHEIERQKKLKADTKEHKMESEFEVGETIIASVPRRTSPAGRKALAKRKEKKYRPTHKDPEIDLEIKTHGEENVRILYDSNP
jgi:hypothetical protein